jgi:hypothetical protein
VGRGILRPTITLLHRTSAKNNDSAEYIKKKYVSYEGGTSSRRSAHLLRFSPPTPFFRPLFTEVRGRGILGTSHYPNSANFAFWAFSEVG